MEEFNLSEKIYGEKQSYPRLLVKDVKEFIKRLKEFVSIREKETMEEIIGHGLTERERVYLQKEVKDKLTNFIDKLAGEKLIKSDGGGKYDNNNTNKRYK